MDETLDPMIDPILEQATFMDGSQRMIVLDDKALPWDENFRLYLTSKLGERGGRGRQACCWSTRCDHLSPRRPAANPHYSPEVMGKVMIINYGVTQQGLENQLLNVVGEAGAARLEPC